jgi:hypothetical protein
MRVHSWLLLEKIFTLNIELPSLPAVLLSLSSVNSQCGLLISMVFHEALLQMKEPFYSKISVWKLALSMVFIDLTRALQSPETTSLIEW